MAILPLVIGQDTPVLRAKAKQVHSASKDIKKLIKDMHETVRAEDGLGLAAPQIGESLRLCLCSFDGKMTTLINPEILWKSEDLATAEEGCLSLPKVSVHVTRPHEIIVQYRDEDFCEQERKLKGLNARVVQHEVDHLDGVLIVDYA